jgi:ABC-type polysaccharide/polyol phosphate export permease
MKPDPDLRRVIVAVVGALVTFCLVAVIIYARMAHVGVHGSVHGGPTALAAAMAGLFGGGVAALVALVLLFRWR